MAEYSKVMEQFKRMCNDGHCATATGCPMYPSCNIGQCRKIAFERPFDFEMRVMKWAAEHPEPVYPTWGEWLISVGAARKIPTGIPFELQDGRIVDPPWETVVDVDTPIPAGTAQKLGINPKEGNK